MKTPFTLFLFLLFIFPAKAQSLNQGLIKTTGSINSILSQNNQAQFIDHETNTSYFLRKIKATITGDVFCLDSLTGNPSKANYEMFNLLEVKSFARNENEINVVDKNREKIGKIVHIGHQDLQELIKEFDALRFVCILYSRLDPKYKCD